MEATIAGTRISRSGQTTIPAAVRNALHVGIGSTIYWTVNSRGAATVLASPSLTAACATSRATGTPAGSTREAGAATLPATVASGNGRPCSARASREAGASMPSAAPASMSSADTAASRAVPSEWPSSFWRTLGALDDPTFTRPDELDYADDAHRLSFD